MRIARMPFLLPLVSALTFAWALAGCQGEAVNPATSTPDAVTSPATSTATTGTDDIALSSAGYAVSQSAGSVTLTVVRTGTGTDAISVDYSTSDGTAIAGTDYTQTSGTLSWAENDTTSKSITVPVSTATAFSGSKSFTLSLTNPSSSAVIVSPGSASITITGSASISVGTLVLSASTYAVAQSAQSITISVNRTDGTAGTTSVAYATADGTAVAGTDYTSTSGTLSWSDGDSATKSFVIPISNATAFSGSKTLTVALSNPVGGAQLGTPASAIVTINGSTSAAIGTLQLGAASYSVAQNAGSVAVTVSRVGGSDGVASVSYSTSNVTAVAGTDFTAASGTLTWQSGDATAKTVSIAISNATPFSGTKSFKIALTNPSAGAAISSPGSSTIAIAGDASAGSVQFTASSYAINQGAGSLTVTVSRTNGSSGAASVAYSTTSGSAAAGTDFTATNGTLSWTDGDTSSKTFAIPISNATPFSGTKSFTILLASPVKVTLGSPNSVIAKITGDAQTATAGNLQLSSSTYSVGQAAGTIAITVNRSGGSSGAVTVAYSTADGTATAGSNYTATQGTLSWATGDASSKSFSVPISTTQAFSGTKSFTVSLSNPGGSASLGSPTQATVTISGSGSSSSGSSPFWVYYNGVYNWGGDYSTDASINYQSTAGNPESGSYDIAVTINSQWGLWAPYAGGTVPLWDFNSTGYNYITMDLKPTVANQVWQFYFMQVGDVPIIGSNGQQIMINLADYGPAPVAGQWATYKIPLSAVLTQYSSGSAVYETNIYKFGLQDETGLSNNTWYVDNVGFIQ